MRHVLLTVVGATVLVAGAAPPASAQRALSVGVAASVPSLPGTQHAMITLEAGSRRFPLRFRADVAAVSYDGVAYQYQASLLLPFTSSRVAPYLIGGVGIETDGLDGGPTPSWSGIRGGVGVRYRLANRLLFVESVAHSGLPRPMLSLGVQF